MKKIRLENKKFRILKILILKKNFFLVKYLIKLLKDKEVNYVNSFNYL